MKPFVSREITTPLALYTAACMVRDLAGSEIIFTCDSNWNSACLEILYVPQLQEPELRRAVPYSIAMVWPRIRNRDILCPLGCCAVVLLLVLIAYPFADAGFNDDWSYAQIALIFAKTGHVHYNGWTWASLVFQTVWGALWIRIFGFSFNVLRAATLPFSLGFVWLVYALGRKAGLRRELACFGALAVGTSPWYIPLAASFMSDIYGCFFTALCLCAAIRSAESAEGRSAAVWLWVLAISGILGGSDRQIVWAAPVALIPYLLWVRRSDRRFWLQAILAYTVCLTSLAALTVYFMPAYAPLYSIGTQTTGAILRNSLVTSAGLASLFLASVQMALPCFLCFAPFWGDVGRLRRIAGMIGLSGVISFALVCAVGGTGIFPFARSVLSEYGVLSRGVDALGYRPVLLAPAIRFALSMLVVFVGLAFCSLVGHAHAGIARSRLVVFALVPALYVPLLIPGTMARHVHDRYMLPLVPILVLVVLLHFQCRGRRIPLAAWAGLVILAAWGVTATHDYAAALRTRVEVAQCLQRRGVPRSRISAGYEYDGWTELQLSGTIGAPHGSRWNYSNRFWFWNYTRALDPEYVISDSQVENQSSENLLKVGFIAWTPPFRRAVIARKRKDLPETSTCSINVPCVLPQ